MGALRDRLTSYLEDPGRDARESSEAVGREQLASLIRDNLAQQRLNIESQWAAYLQTDTPEEVVDMHYLGMIEAHNSVAEVLNSEVSTGRLPLTMSVPIVDPDMMSEAAHLQSEVGLSTEEATQYSLSAASPTEISAQFEDPKESTGVSIVGLLRERSEDLSEGVSL